MSHSDEAMMRAWNDGFDSACQNLVDTAKRVQVLERICALAAERGLDPTLSRRWEWYRQLPVAGPIPPLPEPATTEQDGRR